MTHTHPAIISPPLRHRMATALNELRPLASMAVEKTFNEVARMAFRDACERMAQLESELDTAQAALFLPEDNWLIEPENNIEYRQVVA